MRRCNGLGTKGTSTKIISEMMMKMEFFLKNITTDEWNAEQDHGRSLAKAPEILVEKHLLGKPKSELFMTIGLRCCVEKSPKM